MVGDMAKYSELELFKFRKMVERLGSKEGRGTELISLYVPPNKQLSDVTTYLRTEYGTAANIKSKTTRKNVQDALVKVIQRLKLFKSVPERGLCIFCGMIPHGPPGTEEMETYVLIPVKPITSFIYRCDARFVVEPLREMVAEKEEVYGIVVLDTQKATFALLRAKRLETIEAITSGISGKHRAGGQSAARFERLRKMEVLGFFKRVSKHVDKIYLKVPDLTGIIIGGPGPTKNDFVKKATYHYELKDKTLAVVDTGYADEEGVKEVIENSKPILERLRYVREKEVVQEFLREIGRDSGLAIYGEDEIRDKIRRGMVKTLLVSEDLSAVRFSTRCTNCGYEEVNVVDSEDALELRQSVEGERCPRCSELSLNVVDEKALLEDLIELAEGRDVNVEIISTQTEEGTMLKRSFSGLGAILKVD